MSSWIDASLVQSELCGILLLLLLAWLLVLNNRLWQLWLERVYGERAARLSAELGLESRLAWGPVLLLEGSEGGVRLRLAWRGGLRPHRLVLAARGRRRARLVLRPDTPEDVLVERVRELRERAGERGGGGGAAREARPRDMP